MDSEGGDKDVIATSNAGNLPSLDDKYIALQEKFVLLETQVHELQKELQRHSNRDVDPSSSTKNLAPAESVEKPKETLELKSEEEKGTHKSRFKVLINKWDEESGERMDHDEETPQKENQKMVDQAFLLRKNLYRDREDTNDSEIEIFHPHLQRLLKTLLHHYPSHELLGDPIMIDSPYRPLVLNWDLLRGEAQKAGIDEDDSQARSDLKCLLEIIVRGSGDAKLDQYLQNRDSYKKQNTVYYDDLWTIFAPGTLVVGKTCFKKEQLLIVADCPQTWPDDRRARSAGWSFLGIVYDWNGQVFQRQIIEITLDPFDGQKPIASLPFHPLDFDPDSEQIKDKLLKRGESFRNYCTAATEDKLKKYSGGALFEKSRSHVIQGEKAKDDGSSSSDEKSPPRSKHVRPSKVDSNVMVDFESYYKYGPRRNRSKAKIGDYPLHDVEQCNCSDCVEGSASQSTLKAHYDTKTGKDEEWEPLQFMLCPPRLLGYVLQEKQWAQLDLSYIEGISDDADSKVWSTRLKLAGSDDGEETKELLLGLVKNHGIGEYQNGKKGYEVQDLVAEKGKGLIILLYGPPGVGKTSTAQAVAMATKKPLFPIGVADVGTDPKHVESNLKKIFDLATTWKAILLIDEADVFLQSRSAGRFGPTTERNALVSVFLRVLEYYQGILILTTNQIAQFDIAVQSRIHIAIKYELLNKEQTIAIFEDFLGQFESHNRVENAASIRKYVEKQFWRIGFDGRQIRNIVTSAMGLARSKGSKMNLDHIQHVVGIVEDFKRDSNDQMVQYLNEQKASRISNM